MRIALDVSALDPEFRAHAIRGTGRYVSELHRGLCKRSTPPDPELGPGLGLNAPEIFPFRYSQIGRDGILDRCISCLPAGRTTLRHQLAYPLSLTSEVTHQADLLHFPVHADAPAWCRQPFVVTVLDLIPLIFKDLYAPKKNDLRFRFARWLELQSIRNATLVFVISENTGKDVHEILGVPWERIVVTPLGVNDELFESTASENPWSDRPYILYVGGIDQRKNISFLMQAFSDVVSEERAAGRPVPRLLMVGRIDNDDQYPKMQKQITELGIQGDVEELGFVSDEELVSLYSHADLFFYPSLYEGFGLPPLEAMASGTPVVCSGTSALPEVVGDAAMLFDPEDSDEAAAALLAVLRDDDLQEQLKSAGLARAKLFTWDETVRKTREGYEYARKIVTNEGDTSLKAVVGGE